MRGWRRGQRARPVRRQNPVRRTAGSAAARPPGGRSQQARLRGRCPWPHGSARPELRRTPGLRAPGRVRAGAPQAPRRPSRSGATAAAKRSRRARCRARPGPAPRRRRPEPEGQGQGDGSWDWLVVLVEFQAQGDADASDAARLFGHGAAERVTTDEDRYADESDHVAPSQTLRRCTLPDTGPMRGSGSTGAPRSVDPGKAPGSPRPAGSDAGGGVIHPRQARRRGASVRWGRGGRWRRRRRPRAPSARRRRGESGGRSVPNAASSMCAAR